MDRLAVVRRESLRNNLIGLARVGHAFNLPTLLAARSVAAHGPLLRDLTDIFGACAVVERGEGGFWGDQRSRLRLDATGRRNVILAAIGPASDLTAVALGLRREGRDVLVVLDASAADDPMELRFMIDRMSAEGVRMTNWVAVLAELTAMAAGTNCHAAAAVRENLARYSVATGDMALAEDSP